MEPGIAGTVDDPAVANHQVEGRFLRRAVATIVKSQPMVQDASHRDMGFIRNGRSGEIELR